VDDSTFIKQAVSHDTLSSNQISDLYNVPFDSDVYSLPVDVVKPKKGVAGRSSKRMSSGRTSNSKVGKKGVVSSRRAQVRLE